jgi:hypothetical protein
MILAHIALDSSRIGTVTGGETNAIDCRVGSRQQYLSL